MYEIDWKQAPRTARWWAMDVDGQAHWYAVPDVAPFTQFWYAERTAAPTFGFEGNWKESLTERPQKAILCPDGNSIKLP